MNRFVIGGILAGIVLLLTGGLNQLVANRDDRPTQANGTQPNGTQPNGAQPTGAQPTGAQPNGTQPTGAQPNGAQTTPGNDLGNLPIEQAGRLARRQSDLNAGGTATSPDTVFNDVPGGMPPGGRSTISPSATAPGSPGTGPDNVIPRQNGTAATAPLPNTGGDIAPVQPGLVQPGVTPGTDADLDSIPALW